MFYRLFLYKTADPKAAAYKISRINWALSRGSKSDWETDHADDYMAKFDVEKIKSDLESATMSEQNIPSCEVKVQRSPLKNITHLYITTTYPEAERVVKAAHAIAMTNGLVLYDGKMKRSFAIGDLFDDSYTKMLIRARETNDMIRQTQTPIYDIRRLDFSKSGNEKFRDYVVTLRKNHQKSLVQRIQEFYQCLEQNLVNGESLKCDNRCFTISSDGYVITYCLEAYRKKADQIGYMENGIPKTSLIHRMGCVMAFKWLAQCKKLQQEDTKSRMRFNEMVKAYPNPADRFVRSVNITKQLAQEKFSMRYSCAGYYGGEFLFYPAPDAYYDYAGDTISILKIEEESARYILPMVDDLYPYIYQRYYLTPNYLPVEMWIDFIDQIKAIREMILEDTFNEELIPYFKAFNLFVLDDSSGKSEYLQKKNWQLIKEDRARFVYEHRYDIAHFYDLFIAWSDAQLDTYFSDELVFRIQGP